jgi:translation initiation factor IF-1
MVKNTTGGKGSKCLARKNIQTGGGKLRTSSNEFEIYARVTKPLGDGRFNVTTISGRETHMWLPGKFRKNKRNNLITIGCYVLIGLREFEKPDYRNSDLLELYSDVDVKKLASLPGIDARFFLETNSLIGGRSSSTDISSEDVIFTNQDDYFGMEKYSTQPLVSSLESVNEEEEEVNFDDI